MSNKQRRGGLGRGLGALIPTAPPAGDAGTQAEQHDAAPHVNGRTAQESATASQAPAEPSAPVTDGFAPVPGAEFALLPVGEIRANDKQPRQVFDDDALEELTHSIREFGVLQPVVVRRDVTDAGYELVMGERRLRAATAAGLQVIPAIVRSTADDAMLRDALLENIHRAQLNPLEEAAAYHQLLDEFGTTHEELAHRIGRSRPQISNTIRLLNLPVAVQRRVAAGVLSAGHARALLSLEDAEAQDDLAARIVAEGLSVRATEELVTLARAGGAARPPRKPAARSLVAPGAADLADRLADVFDTRVRVDIGRRKGRISVEFASIDDLERIVALMAPQISTRARAGDAAEQAGDLTDEVGHGPAPDEQGSQGAESVDPNVS